MPPLIRTENLHRHYQMGQETVRALNGVNLEIERGAFAGIIGPSGSGKSTLLYLFGGLDHPTRGRIWVEDTDISQLDEDQLAKF
ncbi:MAG: ATP-binding cassette domain-containing protein, partial [Anaerolineales bacterium]|nr:ATP-binding cassette domain-containing protein [Anaerolineales bacterium]